MSAVDTMKPSVNAQKLLAFSDTQTGIIILPSTMIYVVQYRI